MIGKVVDVIRSCNTPQQLLVAHKYMKQAFMIDRLDWLDVAAIHKEIFNPRWDELMGGGHIGPRLPPPKTHMTGGYKKSGFYN